MEVDSRGEINMIDKKDIMITTLPDGTKEEVEVLKKQLSILIKVKMENLRL